MRSVCCGFFLLVSLLCFSAGVLAGEIDLETLLADLKAASSETTSLFSRFEQEKHLAVFAEKLVSEGRFAYEAPDHLRWELLTPVASGFVLRGAKGERWNGLSREKEDFSVDKDPIMAMVARQLLAWTRVDVDWLEQRYAMELLGAQPVTLRLTPVDAGEAGFIHHLQIVFAADRRYVAEVLMVEQGGDSTRFRFTDVCLNTPLPAGTFLPPEF